MEGIFRRRVEAFGTSLPPPLFIWEPVPDLCTKEELENTLKALKHVDVISPNHEELAAMFGEPCDGQVHRPAVEALAQRLLDSSIGADGKGAVVVRSGASGCFVSAPAARRWLPACHQDPQKVVDPTGGGNGFLGGFAVGLVRTSDYVEAARWGSIAASFCIEQTGMPTLEAAGDHGGLEKWNGVDVLDRLSEFSQGTA